MTSISDAPPEPLLPEQTADDLDGGWGELREDPDSEVRRLTEDRPPHHDRGW